LSGRGRPPAPTPNPPPSTGAQEPSGAALAESAPAAAAVAPLPEKGLRIDISFVQETWIQVYADGRLVIDGLREAGDTAEVRAGSELLVNLGNAGGLSYTLNGKPGKPFGSPGAVVKNIRITEASLASFLRGDGTGET
jgi:cytoskeleton protein RodZ